MTDQPNPVKEQKEISGHPTDHSRKAPKQYYGHRVNCPVNRKASNKCRCPYLCHDLRDSCDVVETFPALRRVCELGTLGCKVEHKGYECPCGERDCCVKYAREHGAQVESRAPSLPEEGGRNLALCRGCDTPLDCRKAQKCARRGRG
jgi:hypothetical protein